MKYFFMLQAEETFFPIPLMDMLNLREGDWLYDFLEEKPKLGRWNYLELEIVFYILNKFILFYTWCIQNVQFLSPRFVTVTKIVNVLHIER